MFDLSMCPSSTIFYKLHLFIHASNGNDNDHWSAFANEVCYICFVLLFFFLLLFSFSLSLDNALNNVENAKYARENIARPLSAVVIGLESNALR